jgi:hypothetical protein
MKTLSLLLVAVAALPGPRETPKLPVAPISVVAPTPDLASIARENGGTAVEV